MITKILLGLVAVLVVGAVAGAVTFSARCPCDRTPGAHLFGPTHTEAVEDWSFANEPGLCQMQVTVGVRPHSVNLNCMADEGRLYLSCADCDGKVWSTAALERERGRIRINGTVYPVAMARVTDPAELDAAWAARAAKTGFGAGAPRPDTWWSFELTSR